MKRILGIGLFLCAGSVALGISIGTQISVADEWLLAVIANIVAGVCFILAIVITAVALYQEKRLKNLGVTYQKQDFILQMGETYTVQKRGKLRPGAYTVLATDENNRKFNLRVNDYVQEYQHNTQLVLADGDTVSARSGNVILR